MAAVKGGVTTVCAMPNTKPVMDDDGQKVAEVHKRAEEESPAHVIQIGAVTKDQAGQELADIAGMSEAGCHAISEDGKSVMNASLYRKAMKIAKEKGISVFAHCEDITMVEGGVMNADEERCASGTKRNYEFSRRCDRSKRYSAGKETGVRLHLCHCSTADSVEMIRLAKGGRPSGNRRGVSAPFHSDGRRYLGR